MSSKVSERITFEDDKMVIRKTYDATHMLNDARMARELAPNAFASDYKHVGNIDLALLNVWLKEAGVAWDDTAAVKEVIKRKLTSNEFSALRVWDGKW